MSDNDNNAGDVEASGAEASDAEAILAFWLDELEPEQWFKRDDAVDQAIRDRFLPVYERVIAGNYQELAAWGQSARGSLAVLVLLDQFPRNLFRGSPRSFESDAKALELSEAAVDLGHDMQIDGPARCFIYMPMEHAEDLAVQERCCELMARTGDPDYVKYAEIHRDIIAQFGRFPHRNAVLGRETTPEETDFLKTPHTFY